MDLKKKIWKNYLQKEVDASFLYEILSKNVKGSSEKENYQKLSDIEKKHIVAWQILIDAEDTKNITLKPSSKARLMAWFTSFIGIDWLHELMLKEEGNEVKSYLKLSRISTDKNTSETALRLAKDSAEHALNLSGSNSTEKEPWHNSSSGGILRNVVYGFNDGLTANFGLIAGLVGALANNNLILISGISGLIADALSMASSGFLAAKSEKEVIDYERKMEAEEIKYMPETEIEELVLIYQAKGLSTIAARELASEIMSNPEKALEEKVREELGIGIETISPFKEAWLTGAATAIGAFIPVFPFVFFKGFFAVTFSFSISMLAHFAVGAGRSFFTGRGLFRSGFDMFIVGIGIAAVGYFIGELILKFL